MNRFAVTLVIRERLRRFDAFSRFGAKPASRPGGMAHAAALLQPQSAK